MDNIAVETCKCCGAVIPPEVKLPILKMRIYQYIGKHPDCTIDDLVHELYSVSSFNKLYALTVERDGLRKALEHLWVCAGCGTMKSMEQIKGEHPPAIACCPERKMVPPTPTVTDAQS